MKTKIWNKRDRWNFVFQQNNVIERLKLEQTSFKSFFQICEKTKQKHKISYEMTAVDCNEFKFKLYICALRLESKWKYYKSECFDILFLQITFVRDVWPADSLSSSALMDMTSSDPPVKEQTVKWVFFSVEILEKDVKWE